MRHRRVQHAIQPCRRDARGGKKAPRPTFADMANLQRPAAIADTEQPRKANALHHQHDRAAADAANPVPMIIARNHIFAYTASRAGRVPWLGIGILIADYAVGAWPRQMRQDFRWRQRMEHRLPQRDCNRDCLIPLRRQVLGVAWIAARVFSVTARLVSARGLFAASSAQGLRTPSSEMSTLPVQEQVPSQASIL